MALMQIRTAVSRWWRESDYISAAGEFLLVFLLSNLPFGCLILTHYLTTKGAVFSWAEVANVIRDNWKPGEILILVSALLAPFSYLLTVYHRARRHMPLYTLLSSVVLLMYLAASYIFAHDRLATLKQDLNEEFIKGAAIVLYVIALLVWYACLVFQRRLQRPLLPTSRDDGGKGAKGIAEALEETGGPQ